MKKITVSYENDTVSIDDDSIQQFIKRTKLGITSEYIDELEQLCMEKNKTSRLYASLLNMRDQELMAIRGQSSRLDGLWKMVEEQYERLRSFETLVTEAIQSLFVYIFEKRETCTAPQSIPAYLCVSLRHMIVNELKKENSGSLK